MEVVTEAHQLVRAVFEAEGPKEFFRHLQRLREPKPYVAPPVHVRDCHEWDEWEDELEDWQRLAAQEIQEAEGEMALVDASTRVMEVEQQGQSFTIFMDEDAARAAAIEQVEQDLDDGPENFNQDWLQGFIDTDRLKEILRSDVADMERDNGWDSIEEKRDGLIANGDLDEDDYFTDGEEIPITPEMEQAIESAFETYIEGVVDRRLDDPVEYLADIYGAEQAAKEAMRIAPIDTAAAAESAVDTDGWQHFVAHYDHSSYDLPSGAVYVRTH